MTVETIPLVGGIGGNVSACSGVLCLVLLVRIPPLTCGKPDFGRFWRSGAGPRGLVLYHLYS